MLSSVVGVCFSNRSLRELYSYCSRTGVVVSVERLSGCSMTAMAIERSACVRKF